MTEMPSAPLHGPGGGWLAQLTRGPLRPWIALLAAGLCVRGFYDAAIQHGKYELAYGWGVTSIHLHELSFYLWYLVFGVPAAIVLTWGLAATSVPARLEALGRWLVARRRALVLGATLAVFALGLCVWRWVLVSGAQVADDEATYVFIARTLLQGRLVNPFPGDEIFLGNQFVLLGEATGWWGKYPIGHPLLLALGEALELRFLVTPLLTAITLVLTYAVGRRLFGELQACLGVGLLLISPHFVLTGATQLSQPTSTLLLMLGLWAMIRLDHAEAASRNRAAWWALLAGLGWGYGILARPMPGVLFLIVALGAYLLGTSWGGWRERWRGRLGLLLLAAIPVALCGAVILWVNHEQTGELLKTGYHAVHGRLETPANEDGRVSVSVGGALLRQSFWLFGWPLSLLFVPFARGQRRLGLFWALIAAEYAYRALTPKTVVATTGPIYVTEIVPLLALATASGMVQVKRWLAARLSLDHARARALVISVALASTLVAAVMFLPVQLGNIHRSSHAWMTPYRMLAELGVGRALVFSNIMAPLFWSWSYYPPNPSPRLDDEILFVRPPGEPTPVRRAVEFWQRRFADRPAFSFYYLGLKPVLLPLKTTSGEQASEPRAMPGPEPTPDHGHGQRPPDAGPPPRSPPTPARPGQP